jgi:hypothetical protein
MMRRGSDAFAAATIEWMMTGLVQPEDPVSHMVSHGIATSNLGFP